MIGEVDEAGNITCSRNLDVYGLSRSGGTGSSESKHGFVGGLGHTTDDDTGLIYMRARYMDPSLGRFISEDPIRQGFNWYLYCRSNPVDDVDPSGEASLTETLGSIGTSLAAGGGIASAVGRYILNKLADVWANRVAAMFTSIGAKVTPANMSQSLNNAGQRTLNIAIKGYQNFSIRIDVRGGHFNMGFPGGTGDPHVPFSAVNDLTQIVDDVLSGGAGWL